MREWRFGAAAARRGIITQSFPDILSESDAAPETVLHRVVLACPHATRPLYWTESGTAASAEESRARISAGGQMVIPPGTRVRFDGYFGAFPEFSWRMNTTLNGVSLRLHLSGRANIRIWRWTEATGAVLIFAGEPQPRGDFVRIDLPEGGANFRLAGRICFELEALGDGPVVLTTAEYVSRRTAARPVGLALVICTFDREAALAAVLAQVAESPALVRDLAAVIIVNQGRRDLREHPAVSHVAARLGPLLRIYDQANFGGAGGFGRGLLAAMDDPAVTHACLLDDDVVIEAESLRRMIAFFGIARANLALGGQMLDSLQPCILYEAGARVDRNSWQLQPLRFHVDLREPTALDQLCGVDAMDYNGWWQFGFPLRLLRETGMPLPCFIRGDDVEFGLRMQEHGYATVSMPGIAVWHEPFYLKLGGWQLYYEVRNQLIAAALHFDLRGAHASRLLARHLLTYLLTYRYFSAALILQGLKDFLAGPGCLEEDPRGVHARVMALKAGFPAETLPRTTMLEAHAPAREPRTRAGGLARLAIHAARQLVARPRRHGAPRRIDSSHVTWLGLAGVDGVAVDSYWDRELLVFRRSRAQARKQVGEALPLLLRLLVRGPAIARQWRDAQAKLTSEPFWRDYLGIAPPR